MSVRIGNTIIAGSDKNTRPDLFDFKWADHKLNNISWLRADTYSWQDGNFYKTAYEHLAAEVNENPLETDVINGISIPFHRANDGHKIVIYNSTVPEREQLLTALLNESGSAWYYLLDTENRRFKLPRTHFGFIGLRDEVGNYIEAGLPNIKGVLNRVIMYNGTSGTGAFAVGGSAGTTPGPNSGGPTQREITFDASRSSAVYGKSNTVQTNANQMYLYFYVGEYAQTAIEQTAGLNGEIINELNSHKVIAFQEPTSANNYTWYRKYADGWVEQGASNVQIAGRTAGTTVTLPIPMTDNRYTVVISVSENNGTDNYTRSVYIKYINNNNFNACGGFNGTTGGTVFCSWQASGIAA